VFHPLTLALALHAFAPPTTGQPEGPAAAPPTGPTSGPAQPTSEPEASAAPVEGDAARADAQADGEPPPPAGFTGEYEPPFALEQLTLSDSLKIAVEDNLDLRQRVVDVDVSESQVLAAMGAYDVVLTAGVRGSFNRQTPRGSAFVFATGSQNLGGYLGVSRRLETGGNVALTVDIDRTLTDQPISFFNAAAGSARLAEYVIAPTLTVSHPLLRGLGIKVNRASIERARLATSQARATEQQQAQQLVRDLVGAYWDVLYATRDLENKMKAVELETEQLARTEAQVAAGRLSAVEAKAVEQSLATRENEVLLAENALLDASMNLRIMLGQDFVERDTLGVNPATAPQYFSPRAVDVQREIEIALQRNPQVRQLELALASRRIDELEAANQRLPQLDFTGSFAPRGRSVDTAPNAQSGLPAEQGGWGEAFRNFVNDDIGRDGLFADFTVRGQLDLTWQVQNRAAKGNHQQVMAQVRQAELTLQQTRQTIASSVIRAAQSMRTAQKRIEVADISVELAEDNLDAEQARFDVGRTTNYDVLFRLDALNQAKQEALNARIDYIKALLELQSLNGEILPAYGLDVTAS